MREVTVLKDGKRLPCGRLLYEDGVLSWERRVSARHLFRRGRAWDGSEVRDAWTIGEQLLAQLRELGVRRIRYVTRDEIYEIEVDDFLRQARELDQSEWAHTTEPQWALPRKFWEKRTREGAHRQLQLQLNPEGG